MPKLVLIFLILIFLTLPFGCSQKDSSLQPQESVQITMLGLPDSLRAPAGAEREVPILARTLFSNTSRPVEILIQFQCSIPEARFEPGSVTTDSNGWAETKLSVSMPSDTVTLVLYASVQESYFTSDLVLLPTSVPTRIEITASPAALRLPELGQGASWLKVDAMDERGRKLPDIPLKFWTKTEPGDDTPLNCLLNIESNTNAQGSAQGVLTTDQGEGVVYIHAAVDDPDSALAAIHDSLAITINRVELDAARTRIFCSHDTLTTIRREDAIAQVKVEAVDRSGGPLTGSCVEFSADRGRIQASAVIGDSGWAEVEFHSNGEAGTAHIKARLTGYSWVGEAAVVIWVGPYYANIWLNTDRPWIYSQGVNSTAQLTARFRDEFDNPLAGQELHFTTTCGAMVSPVITDEEGFARSVLAGDGRPSLNARGEPDSAIVTVRSRKFEVAASLGIMILPAPEPLAGIILRPAMEPVSCDSDSVELRAYILTEGNRHAQGEIPLTFNSLFNIIEPTEVIAHDGLARTWLKPRRAGVDTLRAQCPNPFGGTIQSIEPLLVEPGRMDSSHFEIDPQELIAGSNTPAVVTGRLYDRYGNLVKNGLRVCFSTTLGEITPSEATTCNGLFQTLMYPGNIAGEALITVFLPEEQQTAQFSVYISEGSIDRITLTADPTTLYAGHMPSGGFGHLIANLYNQYGVPFIPPSIVVFRVLEPELHPGWGGINGRGLIDSSLSRWGEAIATIYPPMEPDTIQVRAYTWRDSLRTDTVDAEVEVPVLPFWPHNIDIYTLPRVYEVGGGFWMVEVAALLTDFHDFPAGNRIPVVFMVSPEIADINPGYTGNQNLSGQTQPGTAFTEMIYSSQGIFQTVDIYAEVQTQYGIITDTLEFTLPLGGGRLVLSANPKIWIFESENDTARIDLAARLTDDYRAPVNRAPLRFTASAGGLSWFNRQDSLWTPFPPDSAVIKTGRRDREHFDTEGEASVRLSVPFSELFLPRQPRERLVQVRVRLDTEPYLEAESVLISLIWRGN